MAWTREKRYRKYQDWGAQELLELQSKAANSKTITHYHIHPISGLINDPNGFSYYNGEYHLFCQAYPFGPVHGLKSWIHFTSPDLVHWQYRGQAINPDTDKDNAGAYSGSGLVHNGDLLLMYTGNHRDADWTRIPYQLIDEMDENGNFHKWDEDLIPQPNHVTEHFRDPQLFEHDGQYYVLLGAQDKKTKTGQIDVFASKDLHTWHEDGYLHFTNKDMGYMIECPNLVFVDQKPVLIFCPQGMDKSISAYDNIYPNMYLIGDQVNLEQAEFKTQQQAPSNLDEGFDIYATQAFNAPDGSAYAVSWVGLPDLSYPSDSEGWANMYSQVKRLEIKNNKLYQHPVKAIESLRYDEKDLTNGIKTGSQYEAKLIIKKGQSGQLHLNADSKLKHGLILEFSTGDDAHLIVDRSQSQPVVNPDYGAQRTIRLDDNQDLKLDIFVDHSLCEIFINDGEHVATLRFFANEGNQSFGFTEDIDFKGVLWKMHSIL